MSISDGCFVINELLSEYYLSEYFETRRGKMEMNITKFGLTHYETVFNEEIEQSIDNDFVIPDYLSDIERIMKCSTKPRITSKTLNGSQLSIDGNVSVCVIYANPENKLCSFETVINFTKTVDIGEETDFCGIDVTAKSGYINCRAVTERKIGIHGAAVIRVKAMKKAVSDIVCDIDNDCVELKAKTVNAAVPVCSAEKSLIVEDTLPLQDSMQPIYCIIRSDGETRQISCKTVGDKAVVKGNVIISVLYSAENGELSRFEGEIPFSQIVELESADENCRLLPSVYISHISIRPQADAEGEEKCLSVEAKLLIKISAFCDNNITAVTDAFSPLYETESTFEDVSFEELQGIFGEDFSLKKTLDLGAVKVGSVVDCWCETSGVGVSTADGIMSLDGTAIISVLGTDSDGIPIYLERAVEFKQNVNVENVPELLRSDVALTVKNVLYNIASDTKIDISIEFCAKITVFKIIKMKLLTDITVDCDNPKKCDPDAAIVIYYTAAGENLWDIAKRYNVSAKKIAEVNEITGELPNEARMLLIPSA